MTIDLAVGEQKQLDVQLMPVPGPAAVSVYDVFIRSNYDPPTAADNYIHARIRNDGAVAISLPITCHYWESWMEPQQVPDKTQILTINPGQTIEYSEDFHGNNYEEYQMAMWLTSEGQDLTRHIPFQAGYHLTGGEQIGEAHVVEAGSDYVVLRYADWGAQTRWYCRVYTPPIPPYEQKIPVRRSIVWRTPWAYCCFWYITGLLPGRLYEAHLESSQLEDYVQFNTL